MIRSRSFLAGVLLLVGVGALALRLPRIADRPLHNDEAVNTHKFATLLEEGEFIYDPHEYHGPTLYYLTLPAAWLSGAGNYVQTTEMTYRVIPVLFGAGLIGLLWLVRDGLGRTAAIVAAVLTAISPAMVFYSRYYIHEMLLVFFTFGAIACGWRYARSARTGWAIGCAAMLALMYATKETWVIALFAMTLSLGLTLLWGRLADRRPVNIAPWVRWKTLAIATGIWLAVWLVLFTSFFTNIRGAKHSITTYKNYLVRGTDAGEHDQKFDYYLKLLAWWQPKGTRIVRTEALILALSALGAGVALLPRRGRRTDDSPGELVADEIRLERDTRADFARFMAFYTLIVLLVYSLIPYKTPWCMLSFLHGMIVLGGIAASAILRRAPLAVRFIVAALLVVGIGQLGWQAYEINFDQRYKQYASNRFNPYVYSQPTVKLYELLDRLDQLARVMPPGQRMRIRLVTEPDELWPLPWYLRKYPPEHYGNKPHPKDAGATVIIASQGPAMELQEMLGERYYPEAHGLRPGVALVLFIDQQLWEKFLETRR